MNAQNITFSANEQVLTKTDDLLDFASNTVSYIEATFTLGTNWTGFDSVRAVWKSDYHQIATVLDANHKCVVPPEILMHRSKVYVNLVGSIAENNVLTDRLTTFPVQALVVTQNAEVDGTETAPVTPSQFEQFVDTVRDEAESISDYSYDSEAWAVGTRGGVDVPITDETYHNNSKYWAEQNAGLSDEVADLKEDFTAITDEKRSVNRWDGTNVGHYYVNQATGKLDSHNSYTASNFIKIDNDSNYIAISADTTTSTLRYALYTAADENTFVRGATGSLGTQDTQTGRYYILIDVTGAKYIRFSLANVYFANADSRLMLSLGDTVPRFSIYTGDRLEVDAVNYGKQYDSSVFGTTPAVVTADSLASGQTLKIDGSNSIKKNKTLHFRANINDNAFDSIYCGIGEQSYSLYWKIDATNIYVMSNGSVGTTLPHGLTLSTYIDLLVVIGERNLGKLIFNTLGGTYIRDVQIVQGYKGEIFLRPNNCAVTNALVEFACKDFRQPIWIFGDSYMTHTSSDRWAYWLVEWGFGRCLMNAFPGENAQEAFPQVQDYLWHYGTPKAIVWCLGMNNPDNSGSTDTLPVAWQNAVESLIKICTEKNITLILSTIPNTPTVSNVLKNAYVRNSGCRYIDFAKAVGAEARGSAWYSGCLSSDNTHPTEKGARLLCLQVLQDVPELML